jgi:alpha-ketoglutarate-dependent taurine dioxygenase
MSERFSKFDREKVGRKFIQVTTESMVEMAPLDQNRGFPILCQPKISEVKLSDWAGVNLERIRSVLMTRGAILFRGFQIDGARGFEELIKIVSGNPIEYNYASTPRRHLGGNIYTSTEYPADQAIPLHNEMSYARSWPGHIWFFCDQPAAQGGETPIADSRLVYQRLSQRVKNMFELKGVMYLRNYGAGLDIPWQKVFMTAEKFEVEEYCRKSGIEYRWINDDSLQTWQVCQGVIEYPKTREKIWFNQAHLFSIDSLEVEIRESLLAQYKREDAPRDARFGDGVLIDPSFLSEINAAYREETVMFQWLKGDILLLDNMLIAHGRMPFIGPRRILVGMVEAISETRRH